MLAPEQTWPELWVGTQSGRIAVSWLRWWAATSSDWRHPPPAAAYSKVITQQATHPAVISSGPRLSCSYLLSLAAGGVKR
jgi:hypothetical protein